MADPTFNGFIQIAVAVVPPAINLFALDATGRVWMRRVGSPRPWQEIPNDRPKGQDYQPKPALSPEGTGTLRQAKQRARARPVRYVRPR